MMSSSRWRPASTICFTSRRGRAQALSATTCRSRGCVQRGAQPWLMRERNSLFARSARSICAWAASPLEFGGAAVGDLVEETEMLAWLFLVVAGS